MVKTGEMVKTGKTMKTARRVKTGRKVKRKPETFFNNLNLKRNRKTEIFLKLWLLLTRMMMSIIVFRTLNQ